jgi:Terminase large subunit, T4likevirus-type, N-terminal
MADEIRIRPQPGFQIKFVMSKADVTFGGGAAGCGKSFAELYIPGMYLDDPNLRVAFFRQTQAQLRQSGSLWDESTKMYPLLGGEPSESILKWRFPKGGIIDMEGIQYEKDLLNYQGAAFGLILFDELTQFSKSKFMFMMSRNRGIFKLGVEGHLQKPQIFATMNPDPDSWVASMIAWYIDQETGYPIPERSGKIRYFTVINDQFVWGDSKKEVYQNNLDYFEDEDFKKSGIHPSALIKSFTFIAGNIYENKKLIESNPQYVGTLRAMSTADQERFLKGNWKVRADNMGLYDNKAVDQMFIQDQHQDQQFVKDWYRGQEIVGVDKDYANNYIVCDAAQFGRDLCIILVFKKFTVVHTTIFYHSSKQQIKDEIELLRRDFGVLRSNVVVDQDGVGGDVVKLGGYCGFMARAQVAEDKTTGEKENYDKFKDQCYFHSAKRVNEGQIKWIVLQATVKVYYRGSSRPSWSFMLDWNNEKVNVKTIIAKQLRAIKRGKVDFGGGVFKLCTNSKDEQKEILGHSPDFADTLMMREYFELIRRTKVKSRSY